MPPIRAFSRFKISFRSFGRGFDSHRPQFPRWLLQLLSIFELFELYDLTLLDYVTETHGLKCV